MKVLEGFASEMLRLPTIKWVSGCLKHAVLKARGA